MRTPISPSLNFLLLTLVFTATGAALWQGWLEGRLAVFVFVMSGWVVSLCLHEFGHAMTAYFGGDVTVADSGYLTLDPLRFTDPVLSLLLPVLFIFLGGFGLPGGAVYIRTGLLRGAGWSAAVAAAGPIASVACLVLVAALHAIAPGGEMGDISGIQAALAVLTFLEATAVVLNLVPLPGLDGFGIIKPLLPNPVVAAASRFGAAGFFLLAALLWYTPLGGALFRVGLAISAGLGVPIGAIARGFAMIRL